MNRNYLNCLIALAITTVTACSSLPSAAPTTYKAASGKFGYGYSETQLTPSSYSIVFKATDTTPADVVQHYALRRAAELTLQNSFAYFSVLKTNITTQPIKARKRIENKFNEDFPESSECSMSGCNQTALRPPLQENSLAVETKMVNNVFYQIDVEMGSQRTSTDRKALSAAEILAKDPNKSVNR